MCTKAPLPSRVGRTESRSRLNCKSASSVVWLPTVEDSNYSLAQGGMTKNVAFKCNDPWNCKRSRATEQPLYRNGARSAKATGFCRCVFFCISLVNISFMRFINESDPEKLNSLVRCSTNTPLGVLYTVCLKRPCPEWTIPNEYTHTHIHCDPGTVATQFAFKLRLIRLHPNRWGGHRSGDAQNCECVYNFDWLSAARLGNIQYTHTHTYDFRRHISRYMYCKILRLCEREWRAHHHVCAGDAPILCRGLNRIC